MAPKAKDEAPAAPETPELSEYETFEDQAAPQSTETPQEAIADPLDIEVPEERLTAYWKGRKAQNGQPVRFRDLLSGADSAEEKIRQQGEAANRAMEESRILRAQTSALLETMRELRQSPNPPRQPNLGDVGIHDPNAVLTDPNAYGMGVAQLGAQIAAREVAPHLQRVEATTQEMQRRLELLDIRSASEQARTSLNLAPEQWQRFGPYLYAAAGADSRGPKDPGAWADAYRNATEAFGVTPPRTSTPQEGIMRGNPPGSSARPSPVNPPQAKTRVRGMVEVLTNDALAGLPPEIIEKVKQKTEEQLRRKEGR